MSAALGRCCLLTSGKFDAHHTVPNLLLQRAGLAVRAMRARWPAAEQQHVRPSSFTAACLCIAVALACGCAATSSTGAAPQSTSVSEPSTLTEAQVIAIARKAIAANDTWLAQAEFEPPKRTDTGWSVLVWRLPKTPGGHRLILIDAAGNVTAYMRGA